MKKSFRNYLLVYFLGLLILTMTATIYAVIRTTNANVKTIVANELVVAERVFKAQLAENRRQLSNRTALLAADFAFKRAIATNEEETIISVLANHGKRIAADMVLLQATDGTTLMSSHEIADDLPTLSQSIDTNPAQESVVFSQGAYYQLVTAAVRAPDIIAYVGLGFEIDRELLLRFKSVAGADITLLTNETPNKDRHYLSTLEASIVDDFDVAQTESTSEMDNLLLRQDWLSRPLTLFDTSSTPVTALISLSMTTALDSYRSLRLQMIGIGLIAIVVAALLVFIIAGRITRPILTLTRTATGISQGDYQTPVVLQQENEFGILSNALNTMQGAIAVREAEIRYQASHDLLTGLPNRSDILSSITGQLEQATTSNELDLCLVDFENLPRLRDLYGNEVTDEILTLAVGRLVQTFPDTLMGRFGDYQLLLAFDRETWTSVAATAEQLLDLMSAAFVIQGANLFLDIRLGHVPAPEQGEKADDLVRRLLIALSASRDKQQIHSTYIPFTEEKHLRQIKITDKLLQAIEKNHFQLFYQPKFDLNNLRICGAETLIRWTDPDMGLIPPDEFIPLAERSGNITPISRWVAQETLRTLTDWHRRDLQLELSLNLSVHDLLDTEFVPWLCRVVKSSEISPASLTVEVTESLVMSDLETALVHLQHIRDSGIKLSLDDFGTGFSSLAQLKNLPVDELKIDRSFIQTVVDDTQNQSIVRATITLAHELGLKVVAEGVENFDTVKLLKAMGCDLIQGYYLSKPLNAEDLACWLADDNSFVVNELGTIKQTYAT